MLAIALALELLVFLFACVGMMAAFLGGGGYLAALLVLLGLSLPVSLLVALAGPGWFITRHGWAQGWRMLWQSLPQWLVIAAWLAVALVFCGELALLVALRLSDVPPAPWQHLPVLAALLSIAGFLAAFAARSARR